MIPMKCPTCTRAAMMVRSDFGTGETEYRCRVCGCSFVVKREGDADEDHEKEHDRRETRWPD